MGAMRDVPLTVGFAPESEERPAHFFVASPTHQVCCVPLSGFEALDCDELPRMAAFCWGKLMGENACETWIAFGIAAGWLECFRMHWDDTSGVQQQALHTVH